MLCFFFARGGGANLGSFGFSLIFFPKHSNLAHSDEMPTAHNQVESYFLLSLQCVADVAAMSQAFPMFDQLNLTSMNKELLNEDHMKSVGNLVKIITVGQGPFIQTITPHRLNNSSYFCTFYTNAPIVIEIRLLPTKKRCVCVNFQYCFQYLMFCVNDSSFLPITDNHHQLPPFTPLYSYEKS